MVIRMNNQSRQTGFTLIELVIAMVILAILVALAMPSYQAYVLRSHRGEGVAALNALQLQQEKYRTYHNTYGALATVWSGSATTDNGYYTLAVTNPTATGFVATATAQGNQVNDSQSGTSCSTLTLTVSGLNTTYTPAPCWAR